MTNLNWLHEIDDLDILINKDLTKFSTMKLKACGNLVKIKSLDSLKLVLKGCDDRKVPYRLIGWGANQVIDDFLEGLYIKLDLYFDRKYLTDVRSIYKLPASVSLNTLTSHAIKHGLIGWDVFTGIPASLGGAIFMNAGTSLGEIGELVKSVKIMTKKGDIQKIEINKNSFSYRKNHFLKSGEVIIEAELVNKGQDELVSDKIKKYLDMRNQSQPLSEKTCGCMFKNYLNDFGSCRAGQSLDIIGLKGLELNGVRVSQKHANFMENNGQATYEDVKSLVELINKEFELQWGIQFETEVAFPKVK